MTFKKYVLMPCICKSIKVIKIRITYSCQLKCLNNDFLFKCTPYLYTDIATDFS